MIKRIWHGWTTHDNADKYETLLREEIFPGIAAKHIPGYREIQLLRRAHDDEVEFITIMTFDSLDSVKAFVGEDPTASYIPAKAKEVLSRYDDRSQHYEVRESLSY
ncbi:antibiotic biosynthesis monooxygenase [Marinobacter sp. OP 3.4]|uniref:antibiotic biosynthesis monooxygenase n=1 Tax=Marinobacter sp. OP 3.4 TaxID=3076501 RepID=UPI002E228BB1